MEIKEDHLYHGAALIQIAEHRRYTSINALAVNGKTSRSAYKVNNDIAVYFKYASKPTGAYSEYVFNFSKSQLKDLSDIDAVGNDLHLALVCVKGREICCIPYSQLTSLVDARKLAAGRTETQYTILVTLDEGESFRVYMNQPGRKKVFLRKPKIVSRNKFPKALFR